jgi:putative tryptophan/tyrosine transport system substrate-binding protein
MIVHLKAPARRHGHPRMDRRQFLVTALAGTLASPCVVAGQQAVKPRAIGYLSPNPGPSATSAAFDQALKVLGWVEGAGMTVHRRYLAGRMDRARSAAEELAGLNLDAIVVWSPPLALAVKATGTTTPVVFLAGGAAVELGFATSLARPGGTMTGIAFQPIDTLLPKYLEIAKELAPHASRFALLVAPGETAHRIPEVADKAAQTLKIRLQRVVAETPEELTSALGIIGQGDAEVLVVPPSALVYVHRKQVIAFAEKRRLPGIYGFREVTAEGGLASFSANLLEIASRARRMSIRFSRERGPGSFPSSNRAGTIWSSTSKPPRPSASRSRSRCWRRRIT